MTATIAVPFLYQDKIRIDESGCWLWTSKLDRQGYARYEGPPPRGGRAAMHVYFYTIFFGAPPNGLELDHICHTTDPRCSGGPRCRHRRCMNPMHMEPVTHRENMRRGMGPTGVNSRKSACVRGHLFDTANTYLHKGSRVCRKCNAIRSAAYKVSKRRSS